ncbi:PIN domain-containing protein [Flavobacterium sp. WV_118_3]|uniref:type II toxin-antitoxin system VapC family toxin n=1 Tax=Flavobacterium sp. WV_118_3 TaxID=3151764 RepID=UPI00321C0C7C
MKTLFIDTNIIIDLIAQREPYYQPIAKIATLAESKKLKIIATPLSFINTFYVLSKHMDKKKLSRILTKLRILCDVAPTNANTVDKALASGFNDFEDAVHYHSALTVKSDIFITRNKKDFKKTEIPVMTAAEFLTSINKK